MAEKEYIERDKAIAYVEEQYRLFKGEEEKQNIVYGCVEALKFVPVADAVEVVRCKNCTQAVPMKFFNGFFMCKRHHKYCRKADDYCSHGKRKE